MDEIDTAAIRADGDKLIGRGYDNFASAWHEDPLDEIDRLRARLPQVKANCTASMAGMERAMERAYARAKAAEARLAEVEALHCPRGRNIHGDEVCAECSPLRPMPCPTLRAAQGEGDRG